MSEQESIERASGPLGPVLSIPGLSNARVASQDSSGRPWLWRSASVDMLDSAGFRQLAEAGVRRILDLREPSEYNPGICSEERAIPTHRLPLYDLPDGPPRSGSFAEVYDLLLHHRPERVIDAVRYIAEAPRGVLVHCTLGKDRTGLIIALSRLAAGDRENEVIADYAASAGQLSAQQRDWVVSRIRAQVPDPATQQQALDLHLTSPAAALGAVVKTLKENWGGADGYLRHYGMPDEAIAALRARAERR